MWAISDTTRGRLAQSAPRQVSGAVRRNRSSPYQAKAYWIIFSLANFGFAGLGMNLPAVAARAAVTVGGPFTLMAADGTTVTNQTYRGRWLLVYFGYTSCPDSCPTALTEIAASLKRLGPDARKVQPVFITIDPQRDTRKIMRDYVQSFDSRMVGLTGTQQQIDAVARAYGAYFIRHQTGLGTEDYLFDHSVYIYLMNPQGTFVRAFDTHSSGGEIAAAIAKAMAQFHEQAGSSPQLSNRQSTLSDRSSE